MKKNRAMVIVIGCMCLALIATSIAKAEDAESTANQLASELQQSGVLTRHEADAIRSPLKNMAEKGAGKSDLKRFVTDLSNKGVKGDDLKESVNSMKDLINKGENPREAGNVVSQAAAQAHADGLKGRDLAAKVHEAINQRKAQKDEAKKKAEKTEQVKKEGQEKAEKAKKEGQEKTKKIEKDNQQKNKNKGK